MSLSEQGKDYVTTGRLLEPGTVLFNLHPIQAPFLGGYQSIFGMAK
jgi:hypothetical protein